MRRRDAVRGLFLAQEHVLLVRAKLPDQDAEIWLAPGGGVETGEPTEVALARELFEETGFRLSAPAREVWTRSHTYGFEGERVTQHERFFLIPTSRFEPTMANNPSRFEVRDFREFRWWSIDEICAADLLFAPRELGPWMRLLVDGEIPESPVDVGV